MNKINQLSLPATLIIISIILGGSYLFAQISKEKSNERQQEAKLQEDRNKEEQKRIEKEQEQAKKDEEKKSLDNCITIAESNYSEQWFRECEGQGLLSDRCISIHEMSVDEYMKLNNLPKDKKIDAISQQYKEENECSCRLPRYNADSIDKRLQNDKDECYRKFPQ